MGNFNKGGRGSDRRGKKFGGRDFGNRNSDRPEMHKATCSSCGKTCEVPFRPRGDKPVYCSDCFDKKDGSDRELRRFGSRGSNRPSFGGKTMFQATCDKCGELCEVPFRPTGEKPIYCSNCFGKGGNNGAPSKSHDNYQEQFALLNSKLDKILKSLTPTPVTKDIPITDILTVKTTKEKTSKKLAPKKVVVKKTVKKAKKK